MSERVRIDVKAPPLPVEDMILDEEIFPYFVEEAEDIITQNHTALHLLEKDMSQRSILDDIRRGFHTLKSAARSIGLMKFGHAAYHAELLCQKAFSSNQSMDRQLFHVLVFTNATLEECLRAHTQRIPIEDAIYASIHVEINRYRQKTDI